MKSTCQNFWRAAQFNASALPVAVSTMRADKATISPRTLPHINMAIVTIKTIIVMVMINKK